MRITYSIIFVSDMSRSVTFYRDVVGMPLRFESPGWTEFETEGATGAFHKSDRPTDSSGESQLEVPGRCRPGLQVTDLDAFHSRMVENNVPCAQKPTKTFGSRIAQYTDSDGLVFSVSEAMPDR